MVRFSKQSHRVRIAFNVTPRTERAILMMGEIAAKMQRREKTKISWKKFEIDKAANSESIAKLLNTTPQEVMELYKSVNGKYPNESTDMEIKKKQLKW
jgi:hypothetical protein